MNAYEKMRETLLALDAWVRVVKNNPKDTTAIECAEFVEETIKAALAAPARNCDVGTADEQAIRMDKFCNSHRHGFDGQCTFACENCKFISVDRCGLAWAQMPYEEGGAK